jgi:hypothetical protein
VRHPVVWWVYPQHIVGLPLTTGYSLDTLAETRVSLLQPVALNRKIRTCQPQLCEHWPFLKE